MSAALERAYYTYLDTIRHQSVGIPSLRRVLADFLDADEIAAIIHESLMGYAPSTTDQVCNGTWNAVDDEIDTDAIARELRARLLGEQAP